MAEKKYLLYSRNFPIWFLYLEWLVIFTQDLVHNILVP